MHIIFILNAILWLSLILMAAHANTFDFLRPKVIKINKFEGTCPGKENVDLILKDIQIKLVGRITTVSLKIDIRNDVASDFKLHLSLKRCQSRDALDTCEFYQNININHMCAILEGENKPWSNFRKMSEPPLPGCPLKKGVHVIKNGTFDGNTLSHLPISGWYWIVTASLLEEGSNRVIFCTSVEGQIIPI